MWVVLNVRTLRTSKLDRELGTCMAMDRLIEKIRIDVMTNEWKIQSLGKRSSKLLKKVHNNCEKYVLNIFTTCFFMFTRLSLEYSGSTENIWMYVS